MDQLKRLLTEEEMEIHGAVEEDNYRGRERDLWSSVRCGK